MLRRTILGRPLSGHNTDRGCVADLVVLTAQLRLVCEATNLLRAHLDNFSAFV